MFRSEMKNWKDLPASIDKCTGTCTIRYAAIFPHFGRSASRGMSEIENHVRIGRNGIVSAGVSVLQRRNARSVFEP